MTAEALQRRMLTAMLPDHAADPPAKWQQRKSAQTRQRLVDAGIDCLVENGYAGLTTAAVAARCGMSRGAMHHHFATRMELVGAVVESVFYQRMRGFLEDYFAAMKGLDDDRMLEVAHETHWRSVHTREYSAFLHLAVAARSDPELDAEFRPALLRYDEVWIGEMIQAFPQWKDQWDSMKLANDIVTAAHIGMLINEPVFSQTERMERLRDLLVRVLQGLRRQT